MLRDEAECGKPAQAESKQGEDRNEEKCSGNTFGVSDDAEPAAMNASAEEKDGAAAAVPEEAKFTLQLKGQRYDPSRNDSSGFSYIGGCYVNMPFTCERCLEDPDHPSRHTVLAGEVKSRFHEMQSKVEQIAGVNMLVIGLTQEYEFEGTPLAVHTFNEYDDSDPIEVLPFSNAKTKQLFFVAIPYSGQVDVACVSEAAHEKRTYELTGDSIMSARGGKAGWHICLPHDGRQDAVY